MHATIRRALVALAFPCLAHAQAFDVTETTIAQIHARMRSGRLTCHALVERYLKRIDSLDKRGPAINALIVVNGNALATADTLDRLMKTSGMTGPLHCIPVIVKDNFETKDLPTTAGSLSLAGVQPAQDAFMVRRIREAGAIILAKANMAEFAFTPYETVGSMLPGYTHNPYALDRVTAGSSGGTAAAVAANLGEVAITVPMGYTRGGKLPAGLQLFGRAWSEPTLIGLAYAYEQATRHRKPPTFDRH